MIILNLLEVEAYQIFASQLCCAWYPNCQVEYPSGYPPEYPIADPPGCPLKVPTDFYLDLRVSVNSSKPWK